MDETSAPVPLGKRDVYSISSISDLSLVPDAFETSDLVNCFNAHFHDGVSNVSVHKIVNLVFIIRKIITRRKVTNYPSQVTNLLS